MKRIREDDWARYINLRSTRPIGTSRAPHPSWPCSAPHDIFGLFRDATCFRFVVSLCRVVVLVVVRIISIVYMLGLVQRVNIIDAVSLLS